MDLHHLKYFVVLSEELHFGRAAQRLHMAQPPLSQRIKDLEKELGVLLFHRRRTGVELSEAGALLLEHARGVLDHVAMAQESMRRIRPGASGVLQVAVPPDTNPVALSTMVSSFATSAPDVLLNLHELTTVEQVERLRDGELDVAVVRHPLSSVGFASGPVFSRALGVVMNASHPLASLSSVRLGDLAGSPLIIFPRHMAPTLYDSFLHTCRDAGYLPAAIVHARNQHFTHGLIMAGRGVHFNEEPWTPLPSGIVWRPLVGDPLAWRTSALWLKSRRSAETDAFVAAVGAGLEAGGHVA
ncbi:LysR substrate-binding domain-containing protein [Paenarthrobacter sp. AR 02]|uniref:LysR substrate-binding domain-containing protein n=1 Tax=Paenarthrobacter sp. AR 02 TaxID=2899821 RepID=UPI001F1913CF|nr:LysR substrate-binding domain-containing protein [Paenarthrobacter sp. AR 02]MCF3138272.1 LysR substrate-binding domain-containing protein [Paenarthrobacter sp. AR 02]